MRFFNSTVSTAFDQSNMNRQIVLAMLIAMIGLNVCGCAKNADRDLSQGSAIRQAVKAVLPDASVKVTLTIWHDSFDAAQAAATKSGKPILACFTGSDWCHWCVKLKDDVFEKEEFEQWASENVVLLELDYPQRNMQSQKIRKQNEALKSKYSVSGFPTVLFLDGDGAVLGKLGYGKTPSEWIKNAEAILEPSDSTEPSDFVGN